MHKIWAVIRREFLERVRTKWFLIATVLGPVFMIGMGVLPSLLLTRGAGITRIVLLDAGSGPLAARVETQLKRSGRFHVTPLVTDPDRQQAVVDSLTAAVQRKEIDGVLTLTPATLESGSTEYRARNVSSPTDMATLERATRQAVTVERLSRRGIDPAVVQEAQGNIDMKTLRISKRGATGESGVATFLLGYALAVILYVVMLAYGITVMRSVVQEKSDRVIELLISSLRPFELMFGKVIGVGGVGLLQMLIWGVVGLGTMKYRAKLLGLFGVKADAVASFQLPHIGTDLLVIVLVYFVLGYLFYSALFAMVGAAVNSETEAGQAQQPVMMLLVVSMILSIGAIGDPSGPIARWGSLIPFSSPIVMPVRAATSDVAPTELALSLALMVGATLLAMWVAGRIYRIGILMYGKRPSMKELWRWARQS
jgi:ABC-2 type transport system permease protein